MNVIDANRPLTQPDSVQVVHGQNGRSLILVTDESESFALPGAVIADQVNVDDFSVLAEHGDDVALREVVGEAADKDPGGIAVLVVPRLGRAAEDARGQLAVVHRVQVLDVR